jgi:phosphoenolpyruvate carboxylase
MYTLPKIERFNQNVLSKYHIYNSVFITLPFDAIDNTGVLLPLFSEVCDNGFKNNWSPKQIVDFFADKYLDKPTEDKKVDLMFRFIQYVERQIVLFDFFQKTNVLFKPTSKKTKTKKNQVKRKRKKSFHL